MILGPVEVILIMHGHSPAECIVASSPGRGEKRPGV